MLFRISNELGHYRLGVTITARGRAADRNRIKRKLREWFRHHEKELGSFDYNVVISGSRKIEFPYPDRLIEALDREFLYALSARRRA